MTAAEGVDKQRLHCIHGASLAARLEMLLDLYAPTVEVKAGVFVRDPEQGILTRDEFLRLLETLR